MTPHEIRYKYSTRTPEVIGKLQFFADSHLNPKLRKVVQPLRYIAFHVVDSSEDGPELIIGLSRLLDARDSFIRHYLATHNFHSKSSDEN